MYGRRDGASRQWGFDRRQAVACVSSKESERAPAFLAAALRWWVG